MANPRGIMPESLIASDQKDAAIRWLRDAPINRRLRSQLLRGWGIETNTPLTGEDFAALQPPPAP